MKFECITEKMVSGLNLISRVASKHLTLPVLSCVLLEVVNSNLFLRATNLEIGIEVTIPVRGAEGGRVAVSADLLRNYLSSLSGERTLSVEVKDSKLTLSTEHTTTTLTTYPPEDFPSLPGVESGKSFSLDSEDLVNGFKSVLHSASLSSMKPELSSVYVYQEDGALYFVATDSFRLSEKKVSTQIDAFESLLIPHKNALEATRALEEGGRVEVQVGESQVVFRTSDVFVTSRVVEGVFPDYRQIIPKEHTTSITVLYKDLVNALKVGTIFADKFNKVNLSVEKGKGLVVKTQNTEIGEHESVIEGAVEGGGISMNFNSRYITDGLSSVGTDSVVLEFSEGKPMVIKGVGDLSFTYLVMAMNK